MKKIIILASAFSIMLFASSCKKDKEEVPVATSLSTAESKVTLTQTSNSLKTDLSTMTENESMDAFEMFANIADKLGEEESIELSRRGKKSYKGYAKALKNALNNVENASNARLAADDFSFSTTKGVYEWNVSLDDFEKTADNSKLIIKFPSEENGTVNDASLTVNSYTEDSNENPTKIDITLNQNSTLILSINYSAAYDSNDEPTSFDGKVSMPPFTYSADLKKSGKSVSFNTKIENKNSAIPIASTSFNGTFADETYDSPEKINGSAQLYEVTLVGDMNVKAMQDADSTGKQGDEMEKIINDNAKAYFKKTSTNQKIGDVVLDVVKSSDGLNDDEPKFYVKYVDGTQEDLETVFEGVINEMEDAIEELFGEDDSISAE